jgi:hypothetical protein
MVTTSSSLMTTMASLTFILTASLVEESFCEHPYPFEPPIGGWKLHKRRGVVETPEVTTSISQPPPFRPHSPVLNAKSAYVYDDYYYFDYPEANAAISPTLAIPNSPVATVTSTTTTTSTTTAAVAPANVTTKGEKERRKTRRKKKKKSKKRKSATAISLDRYAQTQNLPPQRHQQQHQRRRQQPRQLHHHHRRRPGQQGRGRPGSRRATSPDQYEYHTMPAAGSSLNPRSFPEDQFYASDNAYRSKRGSYQEDRDVVEVAPAVAQRRDDNGGDAEYYYDDYYEDDAGKRDSSASAYNADQKRRQGYGKKRNAETKFLK